MERIKSNKKKPKHLELKSIIVIVESLFFPLGVFCAQKLNPWPLFSKIAFVTLPLMGAIYMILLYIEKKDSSKLALLAYGVLPIFFAIAIIICA